MRSLVQPRVVKQALAGASLSTLAAWPRLLGGRSGDDPAWFFAGVLFWASGCLWAAVFAWHEEYAGRPVLVLRVPARDWLLVTLAAVAVAGLFAMTLDPLGRSLRPKDYPASAGAWVAQALFNLGFEQLFGYLAPFALFVRLARSVAVAATATVVLRLFMLWLQSDAARLAPSATAVLMLAGGRVVMTVLILWVYLRGGLLPVWWLGLLMQARHLVAMEQSG